MKLRLIALFVLFTFLVCIFSANSKTIKSDDEIPKVVENVENTEQVTVMKKEETPPDKPLSNETLEVVDNNEEEYKLDVNKITSNNQNTFETYGDYTEEEKEILGKIESAIKSYSNPIAVVLYTVDGKNSFCYNSTNPFFSACTIKAAYILSISKYMEENNIELDTTLTYEAKHYHKGSGVIKNSSYGTKYTLRELVNKSLSISDNVAYEMLLDYFKINYHNEYMESLGCDTLKISKMWASNSTTKDFVIVWNEIYKYFNTNSKYAKLFKESCTNTTFNYACEHVRDCDYSHKSGDNFGSLAVYNDVCLIWKDRPYILAIFTKSSGTTYDISTVNKIADLVHFELF